MRRKLAAGNWKMNGSRAALAEVEALCAAHPDSAVELLLCPPATLVAPMADARGSHPLRVGGQDCHSSESGAHTGDISAAMLKEAGASHVIVGHSERRTDHGETSETVAAKAAAAHAAGLVAVICLGETLAEREAGTTLAVVADQLGASLPEGATAANTVVAYEPVWAIGTGKVPTLEQIAEVHEYLRKELATHLPDAADGIRLLYGGSVKASNAADIFSVRDVDGALVGGASLRAEDFSPIVSALEQA
ncbi:Triosephosphate isomerase [Oceanicola granulosus HTCC2516]|uniref:Triosephosphate isomerase n=1 Tax=Oceanicola granulosus (strain ATCC BAA-861 / DSM 15982 / KCTC 12143 / HTCC2516) TaxID=314256 RepID=Q2CG37_OCEGH|nr:triose-phosphate isomerase [Oceanicola granulosus]EAR51692.1 Triosephosphate isomerase [Oceanicola granulosus HTCC2516]